MKKFLLLGAAAMMACAVNAQSLTTVWKVATPTTPLVRTTAGFGDKVFVAFAPNNTPSAGYIEEWENGAKVATYDVNGKMKEMGLLKEVEKTAEDGSTSKVWEGDQMWTNVMTDDAGNIMVGLGTAGSEKSSYRFAYLPVEDRNNVQVLEITEWPAKEFVPARFDVPCRIVGDIATTGAYLYVAASGNTIIPAMYIFINDEGVIDYDVEMSWAIPVAAALNSSSNVATLSTFEELVEAQELAEFASKTYSYTRAAIPQAWDATSETLTASTVITKGGNCAGMDVFSIDGVDYMAIKRDDLSLRGASFEIKNLATGESVASWNAESTAGHYVGSMMARVNADGKTANVYVCAQGDFIGIVKFTPAGASSIENVAADNAPVEYFNLLGVKVANPENGIFVKKQGEKAVKVVL